MTNAFSKDKVVENRPLSIKANFNGKKSFVNATNFARKQNLNVKSKRAQK